MALQDNKITQEERNTLGVVALADNPKMPAQTLKQSFDALGNKISDKFNKTIDDLQHIEADNVRWQAEENARKAQETERITAENARKTQEAAREGAEDGRKTQETARKNAETGRKDAETARVGAENTRNSQEAARTNAEDARKMQETARAGAEDTRKVSENARVSAEGARGTAETARAAAEDGRKTQEAARVSAETARIRSENERVNAESSRTRAENGRVSDETARRNAETGRGTEENVRVSAENSRVSAETARVGAEEARVSAESKRVNTFAAEVKQAQDARTGAIAAAAAAAGSESAAKGSESASAGSASAASTQASSAAQRAVAAQSYAVGGTGTRAGENTDNAKWYKEQAAAIVGGDYPTKAEAQGYVTQHGADTAAHSGLFAGVKTWAKGVFAALGHSHTADEVGAVPTSGGAMTGDLKVPQLFTENISSRFAGGGIGVHGTLSVDGNNIESVASPRYSNDAATKGYVDKVGVYDAVIRTQAEFNALIASPTWLGAVSVCIVGNGGGLSFSAGSSGMGIKIPNTVKKISGINHAMIDVADLKYAESTNMGALWYAERRETSDYSISDLTVRMDGTGGGCFVNCANLTNCCAKPDAGKYGSGVGVGFDKCNNLTSCTSRPTYPSVSRGSNCGFNMCNNLVNCDGAGGGGEAPYYGVFYNCTRLVNCVGTSIANVDVTGEGFRGCQQLMNCIGKGTYHGCGFFDCALLTNCIGDGTSDYYSYGFNQCEFMNGCVGSSQQLQGACQYFDSSTIGKIGF